MHSEGLETRMHPPTAVHREVLAHLLQKSRAIPTHQDGEQMREATRRDGNARGGFFIGVMLATVRRVAAPLAERHELSRDCRRSTVW